jgi:2,3-bisphosphoglycerate-independent phosphoglycerate mutase
MPQKIMLVILDGYDPRYETAQKGDAISTASMPVFDGLVRSYPSMLLATSGKAVGLPEGQMGSSEVGHINIGSGERNGLALQPISDSIENGTFYDMPNLEQTINAIKDIGGTAHLDILLSNGGVHSLNSHLYAGIEACVQKGVPVSLHLKTDGRDCPVGTAEKFLTELDVEIEKIKSVYPDAQISIDTIEGREWGMDRDKKWAKTKRSFDTIAHGISVDDDGNPVEKFTSWQAGLEASTQAGITDEFIRPVVVNPAYKGIDPIKDGVIFFNFRPDRQRQQFAAYANPNFDGFDRGSYTVPIDRMLTMTPYTNDNYGCPFLVQPRIPENTVPSVIAAEGGSQLKASHSQKSSHVGPFLNGDGSNDTLLKGEERVVIKTPNSNYAEDPLMGADQVTDAAISAMEKSIDFVALNYANLDMVGHTGDFDAAVTAAKHVDEQLGRLVAANNELEEPYIIVVVADHGNAGHMLYKDDKTGEWVPDTQHSTGPVPFVCIDTQQFGKKDPLDQTGWVFQPYSSNGSDTGELCDVAPTLLALSGRAVPSSMTGSVRFLEHTPVRLLAAGRGVG